jgi:hypothetical protein
MMVGYPMTVMTWHADLVFGAGWVYQIDLVVMLVRNVLDLIKVILGAGLRLVWRKMISMV